MSSLTARRISTLEATNKEIQQQLSSLIDTGKRNEEKFFWLQSVILAMMDSATAEQLDDVLGRVLKGRANVDEVRLFIDGIDTGILEHIRPSHNLDSLESRLLDLDGSVCETMRLSEYKLVFEKELQEIPSVAFVPVFRGGISGVLTIGSKDPQHFSYELSTLFLDFLGQVVGRVAQRIFC